MLLAGSPRPHLAHAYVDALELDASRRSGSRTTTATATRTRRRGPRRVTCCSALQLTNPKAVTEPNAHLDRDIPRRAVYAKMWEEVKAS